MQLARYQVSTLRPPPILGVSFSTDGQIFAVATETGYEVWRTWPLALVRRRGGGSNPHFPPNKTIIYHDGRGAPLAELEFGERIRGFAVRHRTIVIVLSRKALAFEYSEPERAGRKGKAADHAFSVRLLGEWETAENESAIATAPGATLLALPGRQPGHVQLIHLPPCPTPSSLQGPVVPLSSFLSPILVAHTHPLSSLACSATGAHLITTSERGTLLRVWDTARGALETELRRGVDRAEIWGVSFEDTVFAENLNLVNNDYRREYLRRKGGRVVGWSDKGTVHVWGAEPGSTAVRSSKSQAKQQPSLGNVLSKALSLPNYFSSTASFAQYHLPRKNPHAFSSAIGAAAEAAGMPSMRINEDGDRQPEEREWAERYVVGWIEVEVKDDSSPPPPPSEAEPSNEAKPGTTRKERQLVVVTNAGDWYRLRLPRPRETNGGSDQSTPPNGARSTCELVEYRRLGVSGSGW